MQGIITANREAVLPLTVTGANGQAVQLDTVIDTGYTGTLTLPPDVIAALGLPPRGSRTVILGDGSKTELAIYRAAVLWHGQERALQVLAADGGPLLGMSLLYGSRLTMDILDGAAFTVELLP